MATFAINKYDPNNDPDMPKVGDPSPDGNGKIAKVQMVEASELMRRVMRNEPEPDLEGNRELFVVDNPTRPFVKYFVWVK